MNIGFDGKRAVCNNTGLGNYSRLVIEELSGAISGKDRLWLYSPTLRQNDRLQKIMSAGNVNFATPHSPLSIGTLWRSHGIVSDLRRDKIDIYHGLSNELPLNIRAAGIPAVVTIHDVIYRRLPYCYKPIDRRIYDIKYGHSCRKADRIVAISECTKRDIMEYYHIPEERIEVIYQGCHPQFKRILSQQERIELRQRLQLPDRYIVQVGTIERRKNPELSIRALAALESEIKLVIVGRDNQYKEECIKIAQKERVADRIEWRHDVGFADLPGIYQEAEAILYPSRYEGFGLPVIEGILSRRPVIAATGSCLEEAGGEGAIYVDPDNVTEMVEALRAVTSSGYDHNRTLTYGLHHVAKFDTSLMAQKLLSLYRGLINK